MDVDVAPVPGKQLCGWRGGRERVWLLILRGYREVGIIQLTGSATAHWGR